jgi:hypothetical protein
VEVAKLARRVEKDPALAERLKADPAGELARIAEERPAYTRDVWTYRLVVIFLGAVALGVVSGAVYLFALDKGDLPSGVIAIASAAVGALAGLLAPTPGGAAPQ